MKFKKITQAAITVNGVLWDCIDNLHNSSVHSICKDEESYSILIEVNTFHPYSEDDNDAFTDEQKTLVEKLEKIVSQAKEEDVDELILGRE